MGLSYGRGRYTVRNFHRCDTPVKDCLSLSLSLSSALDIVGYCSSVHSIESNDSIAHRLVEYTVKSRPSFSIRPMFNQTMSGISSLSVYIGYQRFFYPIFEYYTHVVRWSLVEILISGADLPLTPYHAVRAIRHGFLFLFRQWPWLLLYHYFSLFRFFLAPYSTKKYCKSTGHLKSIEKTPLRKWEKMRTLDQIWNSVIFFDSVFFSVVAVIPPTWLSKKKKRTKRKKKTATASRRGRGRFVLVTCNTLSCLGCTYIVITCRFLC